MNQHLSLKASSLPDSSGTQKCVPSSKQSLPLPPAEGEAYTDSKKKEAAQLRAAFAVRLDKALDMLGYPKKNYGRNVKLAKDLDVSQPQAFKILAGNIPLPVVLKRLCQLTKVSSDYYLCNSDQMELSGVMERQQHDSAIVQWHWRPYNDVRTEQDLQVPQEIKKEGDLKQFWAIRREDTTKKHLELVAYDPDCATLTDNNEYLMSINRVEQIRLVKMNMGSATLLFDKDTLPINVDLDTLTAYGIDSLVILGKVHSRTPYRR